MLGLPLCMGFSLAVESRGYSLAAVHRLLIVMASLVEHSSGSVGSVAVAPRVYSTGSVVVVRGLNCSTASGFSPDASKFFTTEP